MMLDEIYSNRIMLTDVYNISHHYLKKTQDFELSHIYNRAQGMVLYGVSETIHKLLANEITKSDVIEAEQLAKQMGMSPFPVDMWMQVVKDFQGHAPLEIKCLPEGTWVPKGTPFMKIRNTVKGFGELVTWWESVLLQNSFSSGCATRAAWMRKYLMDMNCNLNRFHNFGSRGHGSRENMMWADTAWNLFLEGTDGFASKMFTPNAPIKSIPATAHKTIQQFDDEWEGYVWSIRSAYTHGHNIVAIVIDTYNADRFIEKYMVNCAQLAKGLGMHIVFRPDSGKTLDQAIRIHNVAHNLQLDNVSVIIGEGMSFERAKEYDEILMRHGVPLNFVAYGIGAGFYKDIDRDWLGWAMKTAYSNGKDRMKFSMDRIKESIAGDVSIVPNHNEAGKPNGHYMITSPCQNDLYSTMYKCGEDGVRYVNFQGWDQIYNRCKTLIPQEGLMTVISLDLQDKMNAIRKEHGL